MTRERSKPKSDPHGFREEGQDLVRGIAGGTIVGAPLLYTMEVWFHGVSYHTAHLLGAVLLTLVLNVAFSYFAGLRERYEHSSFTGAVDDGVTAFALGLFVAAGILALIGRLEIGVESPGALLALLCATLLAAHVVLYAAGFKDHKVYEEDSLFQAPLVETLMTVAVALSVAALLLLLFGESSAAASPAMFVAAVVTLGFPAAVGAAAGRLII